MTSLAAARGCPRAALALPTPVGRFWAPAWLVGAALAALLWLCGRERRGEVKLGWLSCDWNVASEVECQPV
jgi:hypothetical protein